MTAISALAPAMIAADDLAAYRRDGVVALRGVFRDGDWLDLLGEGIARNLRDGSSRMEVRTAPGNPARYIEDFWQWSEYPEFEKFVRESPCAPLAAGLLGASRTHLVMDNWFVREAGSKARAPWHHDIAYFDFAGAMCVLWLPLEDTAADECLSFVRGSHLWGKLFVRIKFADHKAGGDAGVVRGLRYEQPPDIDAAPKGEYDIASFDLARGDCLFFDIRTLHGSRREVVPKKTGRRYTLRMCGEDGRICYRGDWAKPERDIFESWGYRDGDAIGGSRFPQLWPR
jgi:ectoine hydroxylase-related dioxygenase (phytanoyl-CoA dioxygenase family)